MTNKRNNNVTKITIEVQHPETKPNRQETKVSIGQRGTKPWVRPQLNQCVNNIAVTDCNDCKSDHRNEHSREYPAQCDNHSLSTS